MLIRIYQQMLQFYNLKVIALGRNYWMKNPYHLLHAFTIQLGQGTRGKINSSEEMVQTPLFALLSSSHVPRLECTPQTSK
jgi:hypothetical protein